VKTGEAVGVLIYAIYACVSAKSVLAASMNASMTGSGVRVGALPLQAASITVSIERMIALMILFTVTLSYYISPSKT
jgi:hypothetical protein